MALTEDGRLAVVPTLVEAFELFWDQHLPYLVLVYITALPWLAGPLLGFFGPMQELATIGEVRDPDVLALRFNRLHWNLIVVWPLSIAASTVFAIFWFRYLLLGGNSALKLGLATFNRIFWRFLGLSLGVGLVAFLLALVLLMGLGLLLHLLNTILGGVGALLAISVALTAYIPPLAFLARMSLTFAALTLDEAFAFSQSWSATHGSAWRMAVAILLINLPFLIVSIAINLALLGILRAQGFSPADPSKLFEYLGYPWSLAFLLAPLGYYPVAASLAVIALAYRDLGGSSAAAAVRVENAGGP